MRKLRISQLRETIIENTSASWKKEVNQSRENVPLRLQNS